MTNKTPVVASADGTKHETLGSGDTLSPVSIPVSAKSGNSLSREDDGLFVAGGGSGGGGLESVAVGNGLTGNGTAGSPINVKLSKGTGNTATVTDDGLFVPASGGSSSVVAGVTMQGDGTTSDPLEIYFSSQKNNVAGVGPFNSGLLVPAPMSGFDTDGTSGTEGAHPAPGSVIITNEGLSDKMAFIGVRLSKRAGNALSLITPEDSATEKGLYVAPAPKTGDIAYQGIFSVNTQESVGSDFTAAQAFKINANGIWQMKNTVMLDPLPSRFTKGISVNAYLDKIPCDADGVPLIYNLSTKTVSKQVNGAFRQHVVYMLTIMGTPAKIMDITTGVLTDYANNTASMQIVVYYNVTQRTDVPSP